MTPLETPPAAPEDPRWPRASAWLAGGPAEGAGSVDLAVLGVGTWRTSLSPTGAHATPAAVREALARFTTNAPLRGVDVATVSVRDHGDHNEPDIDEEATEERLRSALEGARVLVALGGDNALTVPVALAAFGSEGYKGGLVTLDAHHDVRDGRSNGSPVRRLVEAGLDPSRVVQIGIADFANSREYTTWVGERGIRVMARDVVATRGMTAVMRDALEIAGRAGGPVHVNLDLDVCDRSVAPACPASLPGGISAAELREAAFLAGMHQQVRTVDIAEVDATADAPDGRTVRLAALCLLEVAAGLAKRR